MGCEAGVEVFTQSKHVWLVAGGSGQLTNGLLLGCLLFWIRCSCVETGASSYCARLQKTSSELRDKASFKQKLPKMPTKGPGRVCPCPPPFFSLLHMNSTFKQWLFLESPNPIAMSNILIGNVIRSYMRRWFKHMCRHSHTHPRDYIFKWALTLPSTYSLVAVAQNSAGTPSS